MPFFTEKALDAVFPPAHGLPGVRDTALVPFLQRFRREAPFLLRLGLWASVVLYHLGPIITLGIPLPALALPAGLRERYTSRLCTHPWYFVRSLAFNLKMVAGLCWGQHADVRRAFSREPLPADPGTWRRS